MSPGATPTPALPGPGATWNWIARNWPLLLAILTAPFGLAVLAIFRHRDIISAMRGARRTAWVAAAAALVALGAWVLVIRAGLVVANDPAIPPTEVLVGAFIFGWPHALAAATAVVAAARTAVGADAPARLLALATGGRRGRRDEWGVAMRAELASITASPRERLRFAAGCAPTALRRGWGWSPWIVAATCAALFAP
jgi:hypothetical protein